MNKPVPTIALLYLLAASIIFAILFFNKVSFVEKIPRLHLSKGDISLLVADTPHARELGLSGYESLDDNEAMLFTFDGPGRYGIWMKDMNFSLDIVWIDEKYQILGYEKNVSPETFPKIFYSPERTVYVIEAPAGFVTKNNLSERDVLEFIF